MELLSFSKAVAANCYNLTFRCLTSFANFQDFGSTVKLGFRAQLNQELWGQFHQPFGRKWKWASACIWRHRYHQQNCTQLYSKHHSLEDTPNFCTVQSKPCARKIYWLHIKWCWIDPRFHIQIINCLVDWLVAASWMIQFLCYCKQI